MRVSKPVAVLVLIGTLLPFAHIIFFMATVFTAFFGGMRGGDDDMKVWFVVLFAGHVLCMLLIWGLLAFYLVFLFKTDAVPKDYKVLWAVVLFFGSLVAMTVFWFLYVWPAATAPRAEDDPLA